MRSRQVLKQVVNVALVVAGIGLIAWMLWVVGWPAIEANLSAIGGWFVVLAAFYICAELAFTAGWWVLIDPQLRRSKFMSLFGVYLASYTINYLIPSGNIAGEPVRADLSRESLGLSHALASITVHKHAELVSQWLFLTAGMVVCLSQFDLSTPVKLAAAALLGGMGVAIVLMAWALRRGTFLPILQRLVRWKPLSSRLKPYQPVAEALDANIQTFYSSKQSRWFAASTGWCLVGWCGGLVETYVILRLLSPTAGWTTAVAVEAVAMVLNSLIVFVPGRVGSAEGVRVGVFMLLGLPAAQGVAYSLVRRGRELIWIVPGLVVLVKRYGARLDWPWLKEPSSTKALHEDESKVPELTADRR
ncbi:MAG: lysylphosphatidylglycerol synthase transmembrane domain-containing protein [Candidatus Methylomirabilales bacterium]